MKLTMVFEAQTDDEADQIATINAMLQEQPIGRVTTVRVDEVAEAKPGRVSDETPTTATEFEVIARIKDAIEHLDDYRAKQRVFAWIAQFAAQAGVTAR